ncbi:prohibitin family protein [Velocimicrobium porci]|uniref:Prohibitin family protein n=1 Tax=Velocimicrobium porci TaxID=2606634 RepID=A0A6L5XX21_9FIRM|nr:prohibitin family protein [Velocimicrobium porci]MSS63164.1 prohibitin family protein [Velocimicrobium porci]
MNKGTVGAIAVGAIILLGGISAAFCAKRIPTGYEGVVYSMNGGVQNETLTQGWHLVSPTKKVKEFTIGNEQLLLTKDKREGSKENDSFKVSTADDASIAISFQMSYRFKPERLTDTYKKYKGMDGEDIVNNRVKAVLKSKVSEITTNYSMMEIYSGNRSEINDKITKYLNEQFSKSFGIEVMDASIVDVHPDKKLKKAIDNRVTALQKKQQAEAEQEEIKVKAETKLIKAKNEAEIKKTKAVAQAEANKKIAESITPELIQMKEAEARLKHGWITVQGAETTVVKE